MGQSSGATPSDPSSATNPPELSVPAAHSQLPSISHSRARPWSFSGSAGAETERALVVLIPVPKEAWKQPWLRVLIPNPHIPAGPAQPTAKSSRWWSSSSWGEPGMSRSTSQSCEILEQIPIYPGGDPNPVKSGSRSQSCEIQQPDPNPGVPSSRSQSPAEPRGDLGAAPARGRSNPGIPFLPSLAPRERHPLGWGSVLGLSWISALVTECSQCLEGAAGMCPCPIPHPSPGRGSQPAPGGIWWLLVNGGVVGPPFTNPALFSMQMCPFPRECEDGKPSVCSHLAPGNILHTGAADVEQGETSGLLGEREPEIHGMGDGAQRGHVGKIPAHSPSRPWNNPL